MPNQPFDFSNIDIYEGKPEGFDVYSWSPAPPGGNEPATQVHLHGIVDSGRGRIVWRFKSTDTIDRLIAALIEHREYVWGKR